MGDNDGIISIWGIGENYTNEKPFFLLKSHQNGNELIEDISWSCDGNMMVATTLKKYMMICLFGPGVFGTALTELERIQFLEGNYGSV